MKLGLLGGTFNPIHFGHLRAAEEVRERLSLDKVILIPSGTPPLKCEGLADSGSRLEMVRLAVSGNRFFEVSGIECGKTGKSYSVDTLEELKKKYSGAETFFILGIDAFLDLPNWYDPETLIGLTDFAVINRPPFSFREIEASPFLKDDAFVASGKGVPPPGKGVPPPGKGVPPPGESDVIERRLTSGKAAFLVGITPLYISSTDIRAAIKNGESVKYLLPEAVESFIMSHGLYAE